MTDEARERRREWMREYMRKRRAARTPEQREANLVRQREYYQKRKSAMEPAELADFNRTSAERARRWRESATPAQIERDRARARAHGRARGKAITPAEAAALLAANDGTCDACGKTIKPRRDGADGRNVDHRHSDGLVRGILCARCNTAMSLVDNPTLLAKLIEYSHRAGQ